MTVPYMFITQRVRQSTEIVQTIFVEQRLSFGKAEMRLIYYVLSLL